MSEDIKPEDLKEKPLPSDGQPKPEGAEGIEQDPLKIELDKVQKKEGGRTKKEKLIFSKNRIEQQLREINEEDGLQPDIEGDDDSAPVTVGMLKKIQEQGTVKNALQMAEEIESDTERELVKWHINNTIKSTGNPYEDLRLARTLANASKNAKIIEEVTRKNPPKRHSSATSAPATYQNDQEVELSAEEMAFMKPPFNMKKEDIIKTRRN